MEAKVNPKCGCNKGCKVCKNKWRNSETDCEKAPKVKKNVTRNG